MFKKLLLSVSCLALWSMLVGECHGQLSAYSKPVGVVSIDLPNSSQKALSLPFYPFDGSLNELFKNQLTGASLNSGADVVLVWDSGTQSYKSAFKAENTGDSAKDGKFFEDDVSWVDSSITLASGIGFIVQNNQAFDQKLYLFGGLVLDDTKSVTLPQGVSLISYPYGSRIDLNSTTLREDGAQGGENSTTSDTVSTVIPLTDYYLKNLATDPLDGFWLDMNDDLADVYFGIGSSMWYNRRSGAFTWTESRPYSNLFDVSADAPEITGIEVDGAATGATLTIKTTGLAGEALIILYKDLSAGESLVTDNGWLVAARDIATSGQTVVAWTDSGDLDRTSIDSCFGRLYLVVRQDIDSDCDGVPDGLEKFVYGTDENSFDTDADGDGDGAEVAQGTDPLDLPATLRQLVAYNGETVTLNLSRQSIRGSQFEVLVQDDSGALNSYTAGVERSYLGSVDEYPGAVVAGYLFSDGSLKARVYFDGGYTWFTFGGSVTGTRGTLAPSFGYPTSPTVTAGSAGSDAYRFDVGIDCSWKHYGQCGGNVADALEMIEFSVNAVKAIYLHDAMLEPAIGRVIIRSSQGQCPYDLESDKLNAVKSEWESNQHDVDRDCVALVSPAIGGGVAWLSAVHSSNAYSANGTSSDGSFDIVWRHELGHNWSVTNNQAGNPEGPTVDCGNSLGRFSGPEVQAIFNYRNSRLDYLDSLGTYAAVELPPYAALDVPQVAVYEGQPVTIDVLANDFDANGDNISIDSHDLLSSRLGTVQVSQGTGPDGRDQLVYTAPLGSVGTVDYFQYTIKDGSGKTATGLVVVKPVIKPLSSHIAVADSFVDTNTNHGTQSSITVKRSSIGAGSSYTRTGWVNFDTSNMKVASGAQLKFTVASNDTSGTISVWGIKDGRPGDALGVDWTETGIIKANSPLLPDFSENFDTTFIGSASLKAAGETIVVGGDALRDFLLADTNDQVTFLLVRNVNDGNFSINSRENPAGGGPTLEMIPSLGPADSYVRDGNYAGTNFGSTESLNMKKDGVTDFNRQSYIRFNYEDRGYGNVQNAMLKLTPIDIQAGRTLRIRLVDDSNDSWDENTITWNNRPQGTGQEITFSSDSLVLNQPYKIDVTSLLNQAMNTNGVATFHIDATTQNPTGYTRFASREHAMSSYRPVLNLSLVPPAFATAPIAVVDAFEDIAYTGQTIAGSATDGDNDTLTYSKVGGPAWLTIAPDGTLGGTPSNGDLGLNSFTVMVDDGYGGTDSATLNITVNPVYKTFDAVADTYVRSGVWAGYNYGSDASLLIKNDTNSNYRREAFLRLDYGTVSADKRTKLLLTPISIQTGRTLRIRLTDDAGDTWSEQNTTWNSKPQGSTQEITFSSNSLVLNQPFEIDVTPLLNQTMNKNGIATFHIDAITQNSTGVNQFASKEHATPSYRPVLKTVPVLNGHWKLDEGSGAIATDSTYPAYNGVITGASWVDGRDGKCLDFEGGDYVTLPKESFAGISTEISVAFWCHGDSALQPQKDSIIQARDASDNRILTIHLPWSNEIVYFDCGNAGASYDRTYKTATASDYEGQWNHWVFTKNALNGEMKIYLNGVLWHSATGKMRPLGIVENVKIGSFANGTYNYDGRIDDFRLYNSALSPAEVTKLYSGDTGNHNNAPVAMDDSVETTQNSSVSINVLDNDTDADADALTVATITQGNNGVTSTNGTVVTYTPKIDYFGTDSFTYSISDGNGGTCTAVVTLDVIQSIGTPQITLNKGNAQSISPDKNPEDVILFVNDSYIEPGGSVSDSIDGSVSWSKVVVDSSTLDMTTSSTYTINYNFTNSTGQTVSATRNVYVLDSSSDDDGDGVTNEQEIQEGTDPSSSKSKPVTISDKICVDGKEVDDDAKMPMSMSYGLGDEYISIAAPEPVEGPIVGPTIHDEKNFSLEQGIHSFTLAAEEGYGLDYTYDWMNIAEDGTQIIPYGYKLLTVFSEYTNMVVDDSDPDNPLSLIIGKTAHQAVYRNVADISMDINHDNVIDKIDDGLEFDDPYVYVVDGSKPKSNLREMAVYRPSPVIIEGPRVITQKMQVKFTSTLSIWLDKDKTKSVPTDTWITVFDPTVDPAGLTIDFTTLNSQKLYVEVGPEDYNVDRYILMEVKSGFVHDGNFASTTDTDFVEIRGVTALEMDVVGGEKYVDDDSEEETVGVVVFENWDNDTPSKTGVASDFIPDNKRTNLSYDDNDLVPFYLKGFGDELKGTVTLTPSANLKIWEDQKKTTASPNTWNLSSGALPTHLYVEGLKESKAKRDCEIRLEYSNHGFKETDVIKLTVVKLHLGTATYRALGNKVADNFGWDDHAGLIAEYTGARAFHRLEDPRWWNVYEMESTGFKINTFDKHIKDADAEEHYGCWSIDNLSDSKRNEIIYNAVRLEEEGVLYPETTALIPNYAIAPNTATGLNTALGTEMVLISVQKLRCDALVELCYELTGTEIWGPNGVKYLIQNFPEEHNDLGWTDPDELSPRSQRGEGKGAGISKLTKKFGPKKTPFTLNKIKTP